MKATVDLGTCQGYANCVLEAPEVFDLDDETGKAVVLVATVAEDLHEDARRAEASCPVQAITLEA